MRVSPSLQAGGHPTTPSTDYSRRGRAEGSRVLDLVPRGSGVEGVVHDLLEGHLSTEREGGGKRLLAEFGREGASRLLVQAAFIRAERRARFPHAASRCAPVSLAARSASPLETASAASSSRHQIASSLSTSASAYSRLSRRSASASSFRPSRDARDAETDEDYPTIFLSSPSSRKSPRLSSKRALACA